MTTSRSASTMRVQRVVGDQDGGAVEVGQVAAQLGADLQPGVGVERGQRLVQQQQARVDGQGAGQGDPLGLAAGQLPGLGGGVLGQADALQPGGGAAAGRRLWRRRGSAGRRRRCPARDRCGKSR